MKHRILFLINLFLISNCYVYATTYLVGSTRTYTTPNALYQANVLLDGDIIEIDAETYTGQNALAVWSKNNLTIIGVGGKPHLVANGQYIFGKGIWVLSGNNITVENIEFSGATVPDENGAGIRLDGIGMTVKHCYFHDNENGILTANTYDGDIIIEHTEFNNNGFGDGFTHNLYIGHCNTLTFQYNYSHHATIGHNLKSRAKENYIRYNRIMDETSGDSSRLIDIPNGGFSIILGNLLMQGNNAENNNLVGYGLEGLSNNPPHELYIINNTLVNKRQASCVFITIENGTTTANVTNNIFAGTGNIIIGTTTTMTNNINDATIANLLFADETNYDYHILENSPAKNVGITVAPANGNSLTPNQAYSHPLSFETRTTIDGVIDVGAYEYDSNLSLSEKEIASIKLFPNPTENSITIKSQKKIQKLSLYNSLGQLLLHKENSNNIDLSGMQKGIYFIQVKTEKNLASFSIIKK